MGSLTEKWSRIFALAVGDEFDMDRSTGAHYLTEAVHDDHREIDRLLVQLDEVIARNGHKTVGLPVLTRIVEFVIGHIQNEENAMYVIKYLAYPVNADTHYMLGAPNRRSRVQRRSAPQPRPRSPAMI